MSIISSNIFFENYSSYCCSLACFVLGAPLYNNNFITFIIINNVSKTTKWTAPLYGTKLVINVVLLSI